MSVGQSIAVDQKLRTSADDIYAAGDCADTFHVVTGQKTWIPLALRANRAGWAVADNVCGNDKILPGIAGTAVFKVFDLEVARTGLTLVAAAKAGFKPVVVTVQTHSRAHRDGCWGFRWWERMAWPTASTHRPWHFMPD